MKDYYRVRAEIDLDKIYSNLENEKEKINANTKLMAVIKADGYGHGAVPIAKYVYDLVDAFAVATVREGVELRKAGIDKKILVLGAADYRENELAVDYDISLTVFTFEMANKLNEVARAKNKTACVHIKLDTGMSRIGFACNSDSVAEIVHINKLENVKIEGTFSHFARADEYNKSFSQIQFERFNMMITKLENALVNPGIKHIANSATIIDMPEYQLDMVRSGISTYGLYPSAEVNKKNILLRPAMSIKTCITYIKEIDEGVGISYNSTYVTDRKTTVATIPVGYGDGYPRSLSSKGYVLINGKKAPILGRVCMDQFMVDITDIENVSLDSVVTLVGKDGDECITVEELSALSGSFNYEFVCMVGKRIPRVYYAKGKKIGTYDFYDCATYGLDISY